MAQLRVLPNSQGELGSGNSTTKPVKEVQLVSNFPSYATPRISKTIQTLGKILKPHEVTDAAPVLSLGEGSTIYIIETWRNTGKPISDMSVKSLISQQDRSQTYNLPNAPKFSAGKVISKKR